MAFTGHVLRVSSADSTLQMKGRIEGITEGKNPEERDWR